MTNFSNTGSLPYSHFYCPGTIQARELRKAYEEHDHLEMIHDLLWPFQWLCRPYFRQVRMGLIEAKSNIQFWGGRA